MLSRLLATAVLLSIAAAGCSSEDPAPTAAPSTSTTPPPSASGASEATPAPAAGNPTKPPPGFHFVSAHRKLNTAERAAMTGVTWQPGCPVALEDLRVVRLTYRDFDKHLRTGRLVVHRDAVADVTRIFERLFELGFPIRRMQPIEAYDGSDFDSIEDDNTSAFNCRPITGGSGWSHHAYGRAIDLNPLENPYVYGGRTDHDGSQAYLDRSRNRRGILLADSRVVAAFEDAGWFWGGRWSNPVDYQHFSSMPTN